MDFCHLCNLAEVVGKRLAGVGSLQQDSLVVGVDSPVVGVDSPVVGVDSLVVGVDSPVARGESLLSVYCITAAQLYTQLYTDMSELTHQLFSFT